MTKSARSTLVPILAACLGIAIFAAMDAAMKELSIAITAFAAMIWRVVVGTLLGGFNFAIRRSRWPGKAAMRLHVLRGSIAAIMATAFFWGIARVPLAEGTALSFIAPLITLYLAAVLLKEKIGGGAIAASILGLIGVAVILAGKMQGSFSDDAKWGVAAIFVSAILYAYNLILQRQQAQVAGPVEIVFFQNLVVLSVLSGFLLLLHGLGLKGVFDAMGVPVPDVPPIPNMDEWKLVILSAVLAMISLLLISWAYARAETQILVPVEYTAFIWAAIFGAIFFGEELTIAILFGTGLIVAGCIIAARGKPEVAKALVQSLPAEG